MKTMMMTLLAASVMSAAALMAASNNQPDEIRMQAKWGRSSSAATSGSQEATCMRPSCCRHQPALNRSQARRSSTNMDTLLAVKLGRTTPALTPSCTRTPSLAASTASSPVQAWWLAKWGRTLPAAGQRTQATPTAVAANSGNACCHQAACAD